MPKYRVEITMEFETAENLPDVVLNGTMTQVGEMLDGLPSPEDVDEDKTAASVTVKRVESV